MMDEERRKRLDKKNKIKKGLMLNLINLYEQESFYPNIVVKEYIHKLEAELVRLMLTD
jgi:hypothetical protein